MAMEFQPSIGLSRVLELALSSWRSEASQKYGGIFGAAGPSHFDSNSADMPTLVSKQALEAAYQKAPPFERMLSTVLGQTAITIVGDDKRALNTLERMSVEIIAEALRQTNQVDENDRLIVAAREGAEPPVLLLMSQEVIKLEDSRVISDKMDLPLLLLLKALYSVADPHEVYLQTDIAILKLLMHYGAKGLCELFLISQPEIILTRQPRMIRLCVPSPHVSLNNCGEISTVGIFCHDEDGELGVTACYHGTGPVGTEVTVGLRKALVKHASVVQDTVFIPLGAGFNLPHIIARGGVLADREPARSDHVRFDGATNQNRTTRIFGTDAGLLRARPTIMLKLQTDPDTDQGDSGCALLDRDDKVLGFAFERTAYDDYPQFTDWIWAANVMRALKLTPY